MIIIIITEAVVHIMAHKNTYFDTLNSYLF